jgi:hypothetical protein
VYRQFTYANYHETGYKYTSQVGVILKREYPCLVEDKDQHGVVIKTHPASDWSDYFLSVKDADGLTARDRVILEFWVSAILSMISWCFPSRLDTETTILKYLTNWIFLFNNLISLFTSSACLMSRVRMMKKHTVFLTTILEKRLEI